VRTSTCGMAIGGNGTADTSVCRIAPATVTAAPPASPPTALGHHVLGRSLMASIVPQAGHSGGVPDHFSAGVNTVDARDLGFRCKGVDRSRGADQRSRQ